jgi:MYXO-CTERM domain-containing protein
MTRSGVRASPTVLSALVAFVVLPAAAGELTVTAPPGPHDIFPGHAYTVPVAVTFAASGFACAQGDDFVVTFTSHDTGVNGMPNVEIPALHFDPGQGVFIEPVGEAYEETKTVSVSLNVDSAVARGQTVTYRYTADFGGGTTCAGTTQPPPETVDFALEVYTGAPLPETRSTTPAGASEDTPAPWSIGALAVLAAAFASRRRRIP